MTRVVVLGGGIAGLTAAFRRASVGETIVLEAGPRAGGSIRTIREDGFTLECGPNTLRTSEAAERLLDDLGLEPDVVLADRKAPRWIVRGGSPRAVVPGPAALFNTVFTTAGKLRLLKEPFVARRPASLEDESVHSFFARRFGREAALYGAGPMVSGVYAGDPRALSIRSAFPRLWEAEGAGGSVIRGFLRGKKKREEKVGTAAGDAVPGAAGATGMGDATDAAAARHHRARTLTFGGGLYTLIETLQSRLSERPGFRLETNAAAVAIDGPLPAPGPRWRVRTADGRSFDADVLVSTLPASATARLLPNVLTRSSAALAAVPSSPVTVVMHAYRRPASPGDAPRGFGALIPQVEGFRSLGILYPASLFAGRAPEGFVLTTSFLGGALDRALAGAPDADLLAVASAEVARFFPRLGPAARSWIARWPEAIPQLPLGHHRTLAALDADLAALEATAAGALRVTGGFRDGIALGERVASGEEIGKSLS